MSKGYTPERGYSSDKPEGISTKEYAWKREAPISDKKVCYLSYYGIPEPKFEGDKDWRRHALVLLGLVIVAAAYFVFRKRSRREQGER